MGRSRGGRRRRRSGGRGGSRRNPKTLLRSLIGATLKSVEADLVTRDGELDVDPSGLILRFEDGNDISIVPSHDGESIRVSTRPQSPFPSDEPELEVVRQEQTDEPQWQPYVGKKCEDVFEVRDTTFSSKGAWCGVELQFEDGVVLTAYSWDDELMTHATPEDTGFLERRSVKKDDDDRKGRGRGGDDSGKQDSEKKKDSGKKGSDDKDAASGKGGNDDGKKKKKRRRRRRRRKGSGEEEE